MYKLSKRGLFLAMVALGSAAPLAAQSARPMTEDPQVTVQNNRDEPLTVYLDALPFERRIGEVEPMSTATLSLPKWMVRGERVKLLLVAPGELPLQAEAMVTEDAPRLAVLIPDDDGTDLLMTTERLATVMPEDFLEETTVTVRNDRDEPAEVFIQYGSFDQRLDMVAAGMEQTFRVPDHLVGMKGQIVLVPEDGSTLASWDVELGDGRHLGVHLD